MELVSQDLGSREAICFGVRMRRLVRVVRFVEEAEMGDSHVGCGVVLDVLHEIVCKGLSPVSA